MRIPFQHLATHVSGDCHDSGVGSSALRKLRDRTMAEIVEPKSGQPRLFRQRPPRCPPAIDMGLRIEACDLVANYALAAEGEL